MSQINRLFNKDNENLYNLGAYDTVDTSNADYDLITRKTGYAGGLIPISQYGETSLYDYTIIDKGLNALFVDAYRTYSIIINVFGTNKQVTANAQYNQLILNSYALHSSTLEVILDGTNTGKSLDIEVQYLLPQEQWYEEKVIKNQPLNTLTQDGEQWVRSEYEKTTNLLDNSLFISGKGIGNSGKITSAEGYIAVAEFIPILPNTTYTLSSGEVFFYSSNNESSFISKVGTAGTFTTPSNCTFVRFDNVAGASNIMLNKGSINLPYQPYSGQIMHEADCYNKTETDVLLGAKANNPILTRFTGNPVWTYNQNTKFYTLPYTTGVHNYLITGVVSYAESALYSYVTLIVYQSGTEARIIRISGASENVYSTSGVDLYVHQGQANSTLRLYGVCYLLF